jgi:hypothetical protein
MPNLPSRKSTTKWKPQTPYRLVVVEWEDSQRPLSPWQWLDEYELPDAVRCLSVGFLVAETDRAGDQDIVDRRGLGLGTAAFTVHPLQRQLDRLGFAGVGHAGGAMEGGDAGDIAPHRRRRLERRHGIDEGATVAATAGRAIAPASLHQAVKIVTSARSARSVLPA